MHFVGSMRLVSRRKLKRGFSSDSRSILDGHHEGDFSWHVLSVNSCGVQVLGIIGALDPHTHKVNQANLQGEGKLEREGVRPQRPGKDKEMTDTQAGTLGAFLCTPKWDESRMSRLKCGMKHLLCIC